MYYTYTIDKKIKYDFIGTVYMYMCILDKRKSRND